MTPTPVDREGARREPQSVAEGAVARDRAQAGLAGTHPRRRGHPRQPGHVGSERGFFYHQVDAEDSDTGEKVELGTVLDELVRAGYGQSWREIAERYPQRTVRRLWELAVARRLDTAHETALALSSMLLTGKPDAGE